MTPFYRIIGPIEGRFYVGYTTPGAPHRFTTMADCASLTQAQDAAKEFNRERFRNLAAIKHERRLCGIK